MPRSSLENKEPDWQDVKVFERSDASRADTEWLPWSKRHFTALHRLYYFHGANIEEKLSEAMLSSEGEDHDEVISRVLETRHTFDRLKGILSTVNYLAFVGFVSVLVTRT